jgi:hypothetical protein
VDRSSFLCGIWLCETKQYRKSRHSISCLYMFKNKLVKLSVSSVSTYFSSVVIMRTSVCSSRACVRLEGHLVVQPEYRFPKPVHTTDVNGGGGMSHLCQ